MTTFLHDFKWDDKTLPLHVQVAGKHPPMHPLLSCLFELSTGMLPRTCASATSSQPYLRPWVWNFRFDAWIGFCI